MHLKLFLTVRSIFDKTVFCLGEKQGMSVNNDCISWHNKVGKFCHQFEIGEMKLLSGNGSACEASQTDLIPLCGVNGTECYGS